jgi:lysophospholipase L1-like esterase
MAQNILLLLGSLLLAILLAELLLRIFHVDPPQKNFSARYSVHEMSDNLKLLYKLRANASNDALGVLNKINAGGFRDNEYPVQKDPSRKRVVFLGDSVVYGYGVKLEDTLPKQLEGVFKRNDRPIDVLNFGVSGYDSEQEIELLKEKGLKYKPDVVVVGYTLNDVRYASLELDKLSEQLGNNVLETGTNPLKMFLTFFYDHSYLLNFLDRKLKIQKKVKELKSYRLPIRQYIADRNKQMRDPENSDYQQLKNTVRADAVKTGASAEALKNMLEATGLDTNAEIGRSHWNIAKRSFMELKELSREHHFKVVVVIFPYFMELDKYPLKSVHQFLSTEFQSLGFQVIDPLDFCKGAMAQFGEKEISSDRIHLTSRGSELMAGYLYRELSELHDS